MEKLKKISLLSLGLLVVIATSVFATTGIVNAPSGLVLRTEASKNSTPLATLSDKTEIEILEENGEWYKVIYNNQQGYLFKEYVNKNETPETPEVTEENKNIAQTKEKINVYMIPVITSTVINQVEINSEIKVEKQITNWSYIISGDIQGWIRTYKIQNNINKTVEETPETPQTPEEPAEPTVVEPEQPATSKPSDNSNNTETVVDNTKGFVTVDYANIRKQASTNSEIVTTLTKGTSFKIIAETEEWYKIIYTGVDSTVYEGYIYKKLVTK